MKNPCHCRGKLFRYQFTLMNKTLINPLNLLHEIIPVFTSVHCARPVLNNKRSRRGKKIHFYHTYEGKFCCADVWIGVFVPKTGDSRDPRGAPGVPERRPCWTAAPTKGRRAGKSQRSAQRRISEYDSDVKRERGKKENLGGPAPSPWRWVTC